MEKRTPIREFLDIPQEKWNVIRAIMSSSDTDQRIDLGNNTEFRFYRLPLSGFSALLSVNNQDVFHFMWEEVSGLINISHRIVNPSYRNQGIASEVLSALEARTQRLSNQQQVRYSLMIETTQLSVLALGLKKEMKITRGREIYRMIDEERNEGRNGDKQRYTVDENTHVISNGGERIPFRLSKAFTPLQEEIISATDRIRSLLLRVLKS